MVTNFSANWWVFKWKLICTSNEPHLDNPFDGAMKRSIQRSFNALSSPFQCESHTHNHTQCEHQRDDRTLNSGKQTKEHPTKLSERCPLIQLAKLELNTNRSNSPVVHRRPRSFLAQSCSAVVYRHRLNASNKRRVWKEGTNLGGKRLGFRAIPV